jgi:hypothetical protein
MIPKEMGQYMLVLWGEAHAESKNTKDSSIPEEFFSKFYEALNCEDRKLADLVFSEWVLASDSAMRFDTLSMIYKYNIGAAMDNLMELNKRLSKSSFPSDIYEVKKIKGIIEKLEGKPFSDL